MKIPRSLDTSNPIDLELFNEVKTRMLLEGYPKNEFMAQMIWVCMAIKVGMKYEPDYDCTVNDIMQYVHGQTPEGDRFCGEPSLGWKFPKDFFQEVR